MKKIWHKHKKLITRVVSWYIVGIIFIFLIPIGINLAYKTPCSLEIFAMNWEAKDALSFYGSLLGAAATILALTETIRFTVKTQKEEHKLSIKPRLDSKWQHYSDKLLTISEEANFVFIEYSNGEVTSSRDIPSKIQNILDVYKKAPMSDDNHKNDTDVYIYEAFKDCYDKYISKNLLLLYEIYNYGANNAIEIEFKINDYIICPTFCITTSEPQKFVLILSEDLLINNNKEIEILLTYTDICSFGKYKQRELFSFFKTNNELQTSQAFEYKLSSPKEL